MNSEPNLQSPDRIGGASAALSSLRGWEKALTGLHIFTASWFVYEVLTTMGKDCIDQDGISASPPRTKPTLARIRYMTVRPRGGNGEQAWP
jgi:hypothetical protein